MKQTILRQSWTINFDFVGGRVQDRATMGHRPPSTGNRGTGSAGELNKSKTLDVGCGTGENAIFLAENGFSVVGMNLSTRAIATAKAKAAKRKVKVDFQVGNAGNALASDFKSGPVRQRS